MKTKALCCAALTKGPSHMCGLLAEILGLTDNRPMQKQGGICGFVLIFSVMVDTTTVNTIVSILNDNKYWHEIYLSTKYNPNLTWKSTEKW